MTEPSRDSDTDTGSRVDQDSPPRMPGWVKLSGIILAVLVLLFVVITLVGVGGHGGGPEMHSSEQIEQRAPEDEAFGAHTPPLGGHG